LGRLGEQPTGEIAGEHAFHVAQVETVLQRRFDLIPNLVSTVKGYAAHEEEILEETTRLRSQWGAAKSVDEKAKAAGELEGTLARLLVVAEQYPDLKANQNFRDLQFELAGTENRISVERQRYNDSVRPTTPASAPSPPVSSLHSGASIPVMPTLKPPGGERGAEGGFRTADKKKE